MAVVRCLDEMPQRVPPPARSARAASPATGEPLPGEVFEERTDWIDILEPAGWTLVYTIGHTRYWRRPGKRRGISATTGWAEDRDRLYVFSTSTVFEAEVPVTKFHAYAVLHHDGDHTRAAAALRGSFR